MKTTIKYFVLAITAIFLLSCNENLVDKIQTGTLTGKVVKKGSNEPLSNVKITTSPSTQTVFSATDGTFKIENIPLGDYSVKAVLTGYLDSFQGINLKTETNNVSIVFELADDNSLNSPPSTPQLLTPTDNAAEQPIAVNLTWNASDPDTKDILKYTLTVKNDLDNNVITVNDIADKNYNLTGLKYGVNYFWQISASDGINSPVNSAVFRFKTTSTPQNRFHYVKKSNGNYYIVSNNDTGTSAFNFTQDTSNSFRPKVNNDAGLVAFLKTVNGSHQIFTAKKDGSSIMQITTTPVAGFNNAEIDFAWNKTGNQFIYPNFNKLYRINKDGSGLTLLYTTTDGSLITKCDWSYDGSKIALKTNDLNGYNTKIFIIDTLGNVLNTILTGVNGASGGLNFSVDGTKLLYTYDISAYQDVNYRILDSRIFLYNLTNNTVIDLSDLSKKASGTNDFDPRFSPNDSEIIFMNTSNDGISIKNIIKIPVNINASNNERKVLFSDAEMPDWE